MNKENRERESSSEEMDRIDAAFYSIPYLLQMLKFNLIELAEIARNRDIRRKENAFKDK